MSNEGKTNQRPGSGNESICPKCKSGYLWNGSSCKACDGLFQHSKADTYKDAAIDNAKWINAVLISMASVCGVSLLLKLFGLLQFDWNGVKISINNLWLVCLLLTFAHCYAAYLFDKSCYSLWCCDNDKIASTTFLKITETGGVFFKGFAPRIGKKVNNRTVFVLPRKDPTIILDVLLGVSIVAAVVPFNADFPKTVILFSIAIMILYFNWKIGSFWAISLSELAAAHGKSEFHIHRNDAFGMWKTPSKLFAVYQIIGVSIIFHVLFVLYYFNGFRLLAIIFKYFNE